MCFGNFLWRDILLNKYTKYIYIERIESILYTYHRRFPEDPPWKGVDGFFFDKILD